MQQSPISPKQSLLSSYLKHWINDVSESERIAYFEMLVTKFGPENVICELAQNYWNPNINLCQKFISLPSLAYVPRAADKTMTIAVYYNKIANGGAENVCTMLCNMWADYKDACGNNKYNVVMITDTQKLDGEFNLSSQVKRAYLPSGELFIKEQYRKRFTCWQAIIQKYSIDLVIHAKWLTDTSFWDMLAIKSAPSHPAFISHNHGFSCLPYRWAGNLASWLPYKYQLCDGIVTLSDCDKEFVSAFNNNTRYIPNPLAFTPELIKDSLHERNTIVWLGRISVEKNPLDALKALRSIRKTIPDIQLYVVGDDNGRIKAQMELFIRQNDLNNNVHMVGFTLNTEKYYRKASALIMTSTYEGFPLTLGEALSFGVPVITYDLPWVSYVRDNRGIITVPQGQYEMLAQEVIKLLSQPDKIKALGAQGKQQVKEIAHANILGAWEELFNTINFDTAPALKKNSSTAILFKYLSLYQEIGREAAVNRALAQGKREAESYYHSELEKIHCYYHTEMEKLQKKLNNAATQLANIKNGYSFKLGRILTWIPRKLMGRKW